MADGAKTILVVDDSEDFREQMQIALEADGFSVMAADGQAAAEELLERGVVPDLAILDLMMEHMDSGFVLAHHIKKRHPGVPVILVTAVAAETGMEFDTIAPEEKAWLHADAILDKPVRPDQLRREVRRLLKI
jgi:CheY-like chemotaxis protein